MIARMMKLNVVLATLAFAACVTINVYFPAAAAEQAAEQVIDTVTSGRAGAAGGVPVPSGGAGGNAGAGGSTNDGRGGGNSGSSGTPGSGASSGSGSGSSAPGSSAPPRSQQSLIGKHSVEPRASRDAPVLLVAAGRVLEWLVPAAHAQSQANLDISSPSVRAVTASMQARFDQIRPYLASGAIGVTADGLIEIRDAAAIPIAERATAKRLVAEDNADRATLYAEIAKANGHPEWESDIRGVFAQRWIARAKSEGWYQRDAGGNWAK